MNYLDFFLPNDATMVVIPETVANKQKVRFTSPYFEEQYNAYLAKRPWDFAGALAYINSLAKLQSLTFTTGKVYSEQEKQAADKRVEKQGLIEKEQKDLEQGMETISAGMDYISPTYWYNKVADPEHQITSTAGQVVGDIVLDPTTWLSAGMIPLAKSAGKLVVKKSAKQLATSKLAKLPRYAHPNTDPQLALKLTQERVRNGGAERLKHAVLEGTPEEVEAWKNITSKKLRTSFYDDKDIGYYNGNPMTAEEFSILNGRKHYPEELGVALSQSFAIPFTDAPVKVGTVVDAHEYNHFVHTPVTPAPGLNEKYLRDKYGEEGVKYFTSYNNTELCARFNQVKNYFGLKEGEPVTKEMWNYAKQHYVLDTHLDNTMTDFFNAILPEKLDEFLDWANKNAAIIVPAVVGTLTVEQMNNFKKMFQGGKLDLTPSPIGVTIFNKLKPINGTNS